MVIEDVSNPGPGSDQTSENLNSPAPTLHSSGLGLASPLDRMAAFVADAVIMLPLISLATSRARRLWVTSQLLSDTNGLMLSVSLMIGFAVVTVVLYQLFFLTRWGATPGKKIFGLKVVSIWNQGNPNVRQAFLRSSFWCMSAIGFFLPWLGILSNERRRPWHDRIADTEVVVLDSERSVGAPERREIAVAGALQSMVLCCVVTFAVMLSIHHGARSSNAPMHLSLVDSSDDYLCNVVTEAQNEWTETTSQEKPSRLETAVALFSVGAAGRECVDTEADYALWNSGDKQTAYLAKAISREDDTEESSSYLEEVCRDQSSSPLCKLGQMRLETNEAKRAQVLDQFLKTPPSVAFARVLLVDELVEAKRYKEALDLVEKAAVPRQLGYFFARTRAMSLWGLDRKSDARLAFQASLDGLTIPERIEMARWTCEMETLDGCSASANYSCQTLLSAVERKPSELEDEAIAFSWLRAHECTGGLDRDFAKLRAFAPGKEAQDFIGALNSNKIERGRELRQLVKSAREGSPGWFEAQVHLLPYLSGEEIDETAKKWLAVEGKSDLGWIRLGHGVFRRLESNGQFAEAARVGQELMAHATPDSNWSRKIISAVYKTGNLKMAATLFNKSILATRSTPDVSRTLASAPSDDAEFEKIADELSKIKEDGTTPVVSEAPHPISSKEWVK